MQSFLDRFRPETVPCDGNNPAYVLGTRYEFPNGEFSPEFLADCESCVWLMYRTQFPATIPRHPDGPNPLLTNVNALFRNGSVAAPTASLLDSSAFSSDAGWGCMIRTGQSLLANALLTLNECRTPEKSETAINVLRQFSDEPEAPFSIHRFVDHGSAKCGKLPGQWFGPSAVSQCISEFLKNPQNLGVKEENVKLPNCYISTGQDVYLQNIHQDFPMLILCGIRLGLDSLNPIYVPGLKHLLECKQSVGIAGGRTSASLYFYGYQTNSLLYHDPHEPKPSLTSKTPDDEVWESTHTSRLRALQCNDMDPSMLAGFLIHSHEELMEWTEYIMQLDERQRVLHVFEQAPQIDISVGFSDDEEANTNDGYVVCDSPQIDQLESIEQEKPADESEVSVAPSESSVTLSSDKTN